MVMKVFDKFCSVARLWATLFEAEAALIKPCSLGLYATANSGAGRPRATANRSSCLAQKPGRKKSPANDPLRTSFLGGGLRRLRSQS